MSPVSPVIDKSTFLTPAATNYHIIRLTGISFGRPWPKSNKGYPNCFCLSGQAVMETLAGVREIDMRRTKQRGGAGVICNHNWSISGDWLQAWVTAVHSSPVMCIVLLLDSVSDLHWHNYHITAVKHYFTARCDIDKSFYLWVFKIITFDPSIVQPNQVFFSFLDFYRMKKIRDQSSCDFSDSYWKFLRGWQKQQTDIMRSM